MKSNLVFQLCSSLRTGAGCAFVELKIVLVVKNPSTKQQAYKYCLFFMFFFFYKINNAAMSIPLPCSTYKYHFLSYPKRVVCG